MRRQGTRIQSEERLISRVNPLASLQRGVSRSLPSPAMCSLVCSSLALVPQIGHERPVASMDSGGRLIWSHHSEVQTANVRGLDGDTATRSSPSFVTFSTLFFSNFLFSQARTATACAHTNNHRQEWRHAEHRA